MARAMKDSGNEWIGEIPEVWEISRVGLHFDIILGKMLCSSQLGEDYTLEPYYCASNIHFDGISNESIKNMWFSLEEKKQYQVKCGDLLVVEGGAGAGGCAIVKELPKPMFIQNSVMAVRPRTQQSGRFLRYLIEHLVKSDYIDVVCNKAIIPHFTKDKLAGVPFPFFDDQDKIADFLDAECARIDAVIEQTRASIEEYKKLKQSFITQAVTKGIRPGRKMKDSGVEWIGEIPEEWSVFRIANLYDERNEKGSEDLPILTVSINTGISDHEIPDDEQSRVFVRSEDRTLYKRVYPGDLAYNMMRAWQGAFGAVRVEGMVSPAYVVAKPKTPGALDSRYVEALLRTPSAIEEMHRYSRGITDFRLRLYWPEFKNIRICVPPIEEQIEIADYIDRKSEKIETLIQKKQSFLDEMETYKKSLIFEYVTGKKEVPI